MAYHVVRLDGRWQHFRAFPTREEAEEMIVAVIMALRAPPERSGGTCRTQRKFNAHLFQEEFQFPGRPDRSSLTDFAYPGPDERSPELPASIRD
jgi:hypothetical protein